MGLPVPKIALHYLCAEFSLGTPRPVGHQQLAALRVSSRCHVMSAEPIKAECTDGHFDGGKQSGSKTVLVLS